MNTMASSKLVVLCLVLCLTSGLARPFSGQSASLRQLLQTTQTVNTAAFGDLAAFQSAVASNDPTKIAASFTQLTKSAPPDLQKQALSTALQGAQGSPSSISVLGQGLASAAKTSPSTAAAVGQAVASATDSPAAANTGTASDANAVVSVLQNGAGVSQGTIKATASAEASATNQISTAIGTAIAVVDGQSVTKDKVTAAANACAIAIGNACATAITSVTASAQTSNGGQVIASGQANAQAFASAWSKAFAAAFALAKNGQQQATAAVTSSAFNTAFAQVISQSVLSINQQGPGSTTVTVQTIATQITNAISVAITNAVASVGASKCSNCGTAAGR